MSAEQVSLFLKDSLLLLSLCLLDCAVMCVRLCRKVREAARMKILRGYYFFGGEGEINFAYQSLIKTYPTKGFPSNALPTLRWTPEIGTNTESFVPGDKRNLFFLFF